MAMSSSQKFLVGAARVASEEGYFRPGEVGRALGLTAAEAARAARALGEQKLIGLLQEGQARLRPTGRTLAARLDREAGGQTTASPAGRYGGPHVTGSGGDRGE